MNPLRSLLATAALGLAACAPVADSSVLGLGPRVNSAEVRGTLPPMKRFDAPAPAMPVVPNAELARNFMDLSFYLESGNEVQRFTRFEGPIGVRLAGQVPPSLGADLDALLVRLRNEAGIDIARDRPGPAQITVNIVPRSTIRRDMPNAACFVIPGVSTLSDFRTARRRGAIDWTTLDRRETMAIFIPGDVAPQEIRDCLHEEIAQALGPLNDLYRLPYSIFNDDNVHTILTAHDMLILRATYDDSLRNGMSKAEVQARLPAILARINPAGNGLSPRQSGDTPREWINAVNSALGADAGFRRRLRDGERALDIAQARGWSGVRLGFSHFILGRLYTEADPLLALRHFAAADRIFSGSPDTALHKANVTAHIAAAYLAVGDTRQAMALLGPAIEQARRYQNAALLATLLLLRAEGLEQMGQPDAAREVRLDSLGWARYGFDSVAEVLDRAREVAALSPGGQN